MAKKSKYVTRKEFEDAREAMMWSTGQYLSMLLNAVKAANDRIAVLEKKTIHLEDKS